jgi:hypothetical protein
MTDIDTDIAAARARWVGHEFDLSTFSMDADRMVGWAEACGETDPRFVDPDHGGRVRPRHRSRRGRGCR